MRKLITFIALFIVPVFSSAEIFENIVIRVNNKIVNRYELDKFKTIMKATMGISTNIDKEAVEKLTQILVLEYYTEENSIEISEKDVTREIAEIAERMKLPGEKQIREALLAQYRINVSSDDLRDFIKRQLVFKKSQEHLILSKKRSELKPPSEQEVVDFYNKNKQYFLAPAEVKIAHLVILITKEMSFKEQLAIEKKLQTIRAECLKIKDLKKREEFFYKKVEQEASPIYRKNNGLLGTFTADSLRSLFPQYLKVFELKKGDITDMVASDYGRHIAILLDKKGGEPVDIAKVRPRIEQLLMMQQGEKIFTAWIKEYSKNFKIFIAQ